MPLRQGLRPAAAAAAPAELRAAGAAAVLLGSWMTLRTQVRGGRTCFKCIALHCIMSRLNAALVLLGSWTTL